MIHIIAAMVAGLVADIIAQFPYATPPFEFLLFTGFFIWPGWNEDEKQVYEN